MEAVTVSKTRRSAIVGCLLGTAVGDALGLPVEGLSRARQQRLFGPIDSHRLLFGRGLISDDTEHTILTAQALFTSEDAPDRFADSLAAKLRLWILLVPAGVGFATLRACLRLLIGVSPERSGVFSAGNGPAMRSAILGVYLGENPEKLQSFVRASARLTHTDPKAEYGAFAVALAARYSTNGLTNGDDYLSDLAAALPDNPDAKELIGLLKLAAESAARGESTLAFCASALGRADRVTGYVYQTVPAAIHAWMRHPADYRSAVLGGIACGGDTDTIAAIIGGIVGAGVGERGIPREWIDGLADWPYSVAWIRELGETLYIRRSAGRNIEAPRAAVPALMLRNCVFILVVILTLLRWYVLDCLYIFRTVVRRVFSCLP